MSTGFPLSAHKEDETSNKVFDMYYLQLIYRCERDVEVEVSHSDTAMQLQSVWVFYAVVQVENP